MLSAVSGDPDRTVKSASFPVVSEPLMPDVPVAAAAPVVYAARAWSGLSRSSGFPNTAPEAVRRSTNACMPRSTFPSATGRSELPASVTPADRNDAAR